MNLIYLIEEEKIEELRKMNDEKTGFEKLEEKLVELVDEAEKEKLTDEELSDAIKKLSRIYDEMGPGFSKSPPKSQLYTLLSSRPDLLTDEICKFFLGQIELDKKLFG